MEQIKELAPNDYDCLNDLVIAIQAQGQQHVSDIDADEAPNVIAQSSSLYFEKAYMLTSEINHLESRKEGDVR